MSGTNVTTEESHDALRSSDIVVLSAIAFMIIASLAALARVPLFYGLGALIVFWLMTYLFLVTPLIFQSSNQRLDLCGAYQSGKK